MFNGTKEELEATIEDILRSGLDLYTLPLPEKVQIEGKFNEFIPLELLRMQFIEDNLDFEGLKKTFCQ
jgi:ATP-dependent Lhr-like helicase